MKGALKHSIRTKNNYGKEIFLSKGTKGILKPHKVDDCWKFYYEDDKCITTFKDIIKVVMS